MSLYNMVFGVNPMARLLLAALGTSVLEVPRFRDCFLNTDDPEAPMIVIYTRTGGGNRDFYEKTRECEYRESYAGPFNDDLRKLPGFTHDKDDGFDATYALFFYKVKAEHIEPFMEIQNTLGIDNSLPEERFKRFLEAIKEDSDGYSKG